MLSGCRTRTCMNDFRVWRKLLTEVGHNFWRASWRDWNFCNIFQIHVFVLVKVFHEQDNTFQDGELTTVNNSWIVLPEECARSVMSFNGIGKNSLSICRSPLKINSSEWKESFYYGQGQAKYCGPDKIQYPFCQALRWYPIKMWKSFSFKKTVHVHLPYITLINFENVATTSIELQSCVFERTFHEPNASSFIVDEAALVHMLIPKSSWTFE